MQISKGNQLTPQHFADVRSIEGARSVHIAMPASAFGQLAMPNLHFEMKHKGADHGTKPVSGQIDCVGDLCPFFLWCGTARAMNSSEEN
jgi:hypothetical protein